MFLTLSAIHWNTFDTYCTYLCLFNKEESTFCRFYQNEAKKAVRIFCHFHCFLRMFWLQSHVDNFLHTLWQCSGYLKCSFRSGVSSALWIKVIRYVEKVVDTPFRFSVENCGLRHLLIYTSLICWCHFWIRVRTEWVKAPDPPFLGVLGGGLTPL